MSQRERTLLIAVVAVGVLVGGWFLVNQFYLSPLQQRDKRLAALKAEVDKKTKEVEEKRLGRRQLEEFRGRSLPADATEKLANPNALAKSEYEKYLRELLNESGFPASRTITAQSSPTMDLGRPGAKETFLVPLTFVVEAKHEPPRADGKGSRGVEVATLEKMLDSFYKSPLLHRIQSVSIKSPPPPPEESAEEQTGDTSKGPPFGGKGGKSFKGKGKGKNSPKELDVRLTIEAIVVQGAQKRPFLFPLDRRQVAVDLVASFNRLPLGLALMQFTLPSSGPLDLRKTTPMTKTSDSVALDSPKGNIFTGLLSEKKDRGGPKGFVDDVCEVVELMLVQRIVEYKNGKREVIEEAFLRNRLREKDWLRLRTSKGFDSFVIREEDDERVRLRGKVVRIDVDNRYIIFQRDDGYFYLVETGQNLFEAMEKSMSEKRLKELKLLSAP
jgi:hypothetical protein